MPIYEYRCEKGHTFEVTQRMTDDPLSSCTSCKAPVQRVFHPIAVHFKGKGFYNTDYGTRSRQRELAKAGEGSSDGAAKSDSGSSESSGAAKSDGPAKSDGAAKSEGTAKKSDGAATKKTDSKTG
jgi:putative FmdB family regulatory protein